MDKRILEPGLRPASRAEQGFTLIEALIATVISVTVIMANFSVFNIAQKNLAYSRALTNATNLATAKITEFKTRPVVARPCYDKGLATFNDTLIAPAFTGNGSPCGTDGDVNRDYPGIINQDFCSPASSRNPNYTSRPYPATPAPVWPSTVPMCLPPGVPNPGYVQTETVSGVTLENLSAISVVGGHLINKPQSDTVALDGVTFTRTWTISFVDTNANGRVAMTTDLVRIRITVTWESKTRLLFESNKPHTVTMATFTTGRPDF